MYKHRCPFPVSQENKHGDKKNAVLLQSCCFKQKPYNVFAGLSMGRIFLSHPIPSHSNLCLSHPISSHPMGFPFEYNSIKIIKFMKI